MAVADKARITIVELAERLGVAKSTVSRALNGYPDISDDMRQRVREAAEKFGYQPASAARRFKRNRIGVVAAIMPADPPAERAWRALEGAAQALARRGLDLLISPCREGEGPQELCGRLLSTRKADAFLLFEPDDYEAQAEFLKVRRAPFVALGSLWTQGDESEKAAGPDVIAALARPDGGESRQALGALAVERLIAIAAGEALSGDLAFPPQADGHPGGVAFGERT